MSLTLYVAPHGLANNDGLQAENNEGSGPLPSIQAALDVLASMNKRGALKGESTINVASGTYNIQKPIRLGSQHRFPVRIEGDANDRPVVSGGKVITGFEESVENGQRVWKVQLPEVQQGHWHFRSLYVNGKRRERPRLPKKGFYRLGEVPGMPLPNNWFGFEQRNFDSFKLEEGQMQEFTNIRDIDIMVPHFWICERMPIDSYDPETGLIKTQHASQAPLVEAWGSTLAPCFLENVKEALSEPGEWYLSREDGVLSYLPHEGENIEQAQIVAPVVLQLLKMVGQPEKGEHIEWVQFSNIEFRHSDWAQPFEPKVEKDTAFSKPERCIHKYSRKQLASALQADCDISGALYLRGVKNIHFSNCQVANVGWYGLDIGDACSNINFCGGEINDLGGGGVKINGASYADHSPELETHHIRITDNHIHDGGHVYCAAVGIHNMHAHHNTFAHNDIHHFYYTGISIGWQWSFKPSVSVYNQVEHNHIHHLGAGLLSDMGGVYTLGLQTGSTIRNNHIHHITAMNYGAWCIYPDEGSSNLLIENNLCHSTNREIFHQHYGRENIVRNNIFAFGERAVVAYGCWVKPHVGFRLTQNILLAKDEAHYLSGYGVQLDEHGHESDHNLLYRLDGKDPLFAKKPGSSQPISETISLQEWVKGGKDRFSIFEDPQFKDAEQLDFQLKASSPAIEKLGFKPIDLSKVGPRSAEHWFVTDELHRRDQSF